MLETSIDVIICTHNPNLKKLTEVVSAIHLQKFKPKEIILVDNQSSNSFEIKSFSQNNGLRYVSEPQPGLSYARIAGLEQSNSDIVVFVDDDNYISHNYLSVVQEFMSENTHVLVASGHSLLKTDSKVSEYKVKLLPMLGCRGNDGQTLISNQEAWHFLEPIGAGMILRRELAQIVLDTKNQNLLKKLGRGKSYFPRGGEDTFFVKLAIRTGGYWAFIGDLYLDHKINENRMKFSYLLKLSIGYGISRVNLKMVLNEYDKSYALNREKSIFNLPLLLPLRIKQVGFRAGLIHFVGDISEAIMNLKVQLSLQIKKNS